MLSHSTMEHGLHLGKYQIDSVRRVGQDYSQAGQYFITICTQQRHPYFGHMQPATSALQDAYLVGTALASRAYECWQQIPQYFPFVEVSSFIVMPDHLHGILFFHRPAERPDQPAPVFGPQSDNLASVVRGFKSGVKAWATTSQLPFAWQPRYFDRVIRNEVELEKISAYIHDNPNRWEIDKSNDMGLFC